MDQVSYRLSASGGCYGAEVYHIQTGKTLCRFSGWETKRGAENTAKQIAAKEEARLTKKGESWE